MSIYEDTCYSKLDNMVYVNSVLENIHKFKDCGFAWQYDNKRINSIHFNGRRLHHRISGFEFPIHDLWWQRHDKMNLIECYGNYEFRNRILKLEAMK